MRNMRKKKRPAQSTTASGVAGTKNTARQARCKERNGKFLVHAGMALDQNRGRGRYGARDGASDTDDELILGLLDYFSSFFAHLIFVAYLECYLVGLLLRWRSLLGKSLRPFVSE